MNIQTKYSIVFIVMIVIQILCAYSAAKSNRPTKNQMKKVNLAMTIPLFANLIIVGSHNQSIATIGYCSYYIGMTILMMYLANFTNDYCKGVGDKTHTIAPTIIYTLGAIDIIQLIALCILDKSFTLKSQIIDEKMQYIPIPEIGLTIHRIIDYFIFSIVVVTFIIAAVKTSKLYREKFNIILFTLLVSGVAQAYNIFYRSNIDSSVVVHSVFCVIIYYFSIKYRPLRFLDAMLSSIATDMDDSVFVFDSQNNCVWSNDNGYKLLNVKNIKDIKLAIESKFKNICTAEEKSMDVYLPDSREYFTIEKKLANFNDYIEGMFIIIKNTTNRRKKVEKEIYESIHDSLTNLYNGQYLYFNIKNMLISDKTKKYYIIYINVKNFKIVNDVFGVEYGDQVLIAIANWLRHNIDNKTSIYGRLVGDTFGICMPADKFSEELFINDFSKFVVEYKNIKHQVFIHVGVFKVFDNNLDVSVMFDRAHIAISSIADNYNTVVKYYNDELRTSLLEEQKLVSDLEEAIRTNQIQPYLQPITDINGHIVGAEALARWIHPTNGFMAPNKFIPIFEKNGLIVEIDKYMWRQACQILDRWKTTYKDLFVSINISPKDFYFIDVIEQIQSLVKEYNIEPSKLRIEITETAIMSDSEERFKIFNKFRQLGYIVEMDDFGSGYSSLSMLKSMPVDVLKIDMKFLDSENEQDKPKAKTIVKNVINMSNELNITALTEGVETRQQYNQLITMGCTLFQGYYFAKPMPIADFEKFIVDSIRGDENETI